MQVISHAVDKGVVQHILGHRQTHGLRVRSNVRANSVLILLIEQRGHLAGVENVVDVLHETLRHDLRVGEEKHRRRALDPCLVVQRLEIVAELVHAVSARELNAETLETRHERGEARQALLPGTPHTHQHRVTAGLAEDASDPRGVLRRVLEEDEVHGVGGGEIILLEIILHQFHHLFEIGALLVCAIFRCLAHGEKIPEDDLALEEELLVGGPPAEILLHQLRHHLLEVFLVFDGDEAVVEHAHGLVHP